MGEVGHSAPSGHRRKGRRTGVRPIPRWSRPRDNQGREERRSDSDGGKHVVDHPSTRPWNGGTSFDPSLSRSSFPHPSRVGPGLSLIRVCPPRADGLPDLAPGGTLCREKGGGGRRTGPDKTGTPPSLGPVDPTNSCSRESASALERTVWAGVGWGHTLRTPLTAVPLRSPVRPPSPVPAGANLT